MKKQLKDEQQNIFYEVEYLVSEKILYSNWTGSYLSVDQVKEGSLLALDLMRENECQLLLNDNRELEGTWDEANEWIANEWMPQAIQSGLKRFAHILPQDLFAELSAELMEENAKKVEGGFQLKMFNNREEAENWLLENSAKAELENGNLTS